MSSSCEPHFISGHTNPAYMKDDDEDDDDISRDRACDSGSDVSSGESDVERDTMTPDLRRFINP